MSRLTWTHRRHSRIRTVAAAGALALTFTASSDSARAQTIPLVNPGFESAFAGWTYYTKKKADAIRTSTDAHTGSISMELKDKDAWIVQETAYVLSPGDDVTLRFWVKDPPKEDEDDANWNAALVWIDGTGAVQTIQSIQAWRAKSWEERMLAFTIPAADPSVGQRLAVFFGSGKKRILLDDVALEVNNRSCVGDPTEYAGSLKNLKKRVYAVPVVLTQTGVLHSIAAFTKGKEKEKIRYAVYADAAGMPGARLVQTVAEPLGSKNWHWHTTAAPAVTLLPGTYWVAMAVEKDKQKLAVQSGGTAFWYSGKAAKKGFVANWTSTQTDGYRFSVVLCYTAGSDPGLVGWWKLDEAAGYVASDSSGRDHHGTLLNIDPATAWQSARCGRGLEFNGINSKVTVPDNGDFDNTSQLTVAFWCKPYVLDGNPRGPICKRINWTSEYSWGIFFYGGNRLNVDIASNDDRFASNYTFTENEWVHVAVVFDGTLPQAGRVAVYVNGVLDTTAPESSSTIPDTASPLVIGQLNGNGAGYYSGLLDEIRVYRRALPVTEIADAMNCASGIPQVVRWREVIK